MPLPSPNYTPGRHTPYYTHPDIRIYELNKRLQQRSEESDNLWWDALVTEFFEDDATLTLAFCLEDGPKRYTIGRTLIPRYFRSIFEGGVKELYYILNLPKDTYQNSTVTMHCENTTMVTHHTRPYSTKVCTDGHLIVDFTFDDFMRIRNWHFNIVNHREFIPRSGLTVQDPQVLEQLSKNITRQGMTSVTLNYLRLCVILEPMQELMSRHKTYTMSPRDCLKSTLFQRWPRGGPPGSDFNQPDYIWPREPDQKEFRQIAETNPRPPRKPAKKRTRSNTASGSSSNTTNSSSSAKKKTSPATPTSGFSISSQDVMVVGEPSLMGGDFGEEDERLITSLSSA